ncbi:MAG: sterol desaturase family protein [Deltaproteobacteria bacterium]|nr:sterol desaturase family protein [Deltaproteobacteria bacterium]
MRSWLAHTHWSLVALAVWLFFAALTALGLVSGTVMERSAIAKGRKVYDLALGAGQRRHEALGTALSMVVIPGLVALCVCTGALSFATGAAAQVLSFVVPWFGFQFYYYWLHRAMHHKRLLWMHKWHHRSWVTSPWTGLSMHPVEAVGWAVGLLWPALLLSRFGLLGLEGWMAFFVIQWTGNIAGHANAEIFPMRVTRWVSILSSNAISYHSLHHARYAKHYGFATATMDWLFGTEWADWQAVHLRVMDGRPMTSLKERATTEDDGAATNG